MPGYKYGPHTGPKKLNKRLTSPGQVVKLVFAPSPAGFQWNTTSWGFLTATWTWLEGWGMWARNRNRDRDTTPSPPASRKLLRRTKQAAVLIAFGVAEARRLTLTFRGKSLELLWSQRRRRTEDVALPTRPSRAINYAIGETSGRLPLLFFPRDKQTNAIWFVCRLDWSATEKCNLISHSIVKGNAWR